MAPDLVVSLISAGPWVAARVRRRLDSLLAALPSMLPLYLVALYLVALHIVALHPVALYLVAS